MMKQPECPYCLEYVETDAAVLCKACGTAHHSECWEENSGCVAKNCRAKSNSLSIDIDPDERTRLELTTEAIMASKSHREGTFKNPCIKCGKIVAEGQLYCEECEPEPIETDDKRNLAPMIVIFLVLSVLLAWIIVTQMESKPDDTNIPTHPAGDFTNTK